MRKIFRYNKYNIGVNVCNRYNNYIHIALHGEDNMALYQQSKLFSILALSPYLVSRTIVISLVLFKKLFAINLLTALLLQPYCIWIHHTNKDTQLLSIDSSNYIL